MIDHIELRTRDLPASVRFYAAVLDLRDPDGRLVEFTCHEAE